MTDPSALIARLLGPDGPEITCERCFEELDVYVELTAAGKTGQIVPDMRAHLDGCPACREEYESLLALLADDAPAR
jgi:predicted anti-sigma-YlaC factor YlaD